MIFFYLLNVYICVLVLTFTLYFQESIAASWCCLSSCQLEGARSLAHHSSETHRIHGLHCHLRWPSGKILSLFLLIVGLVMLNCDTIMLAGIILKCAINTSSWLLDPLWREKRKYQKSLSEVTTEHRMSNITMKAMCLRERERANFVGRVQILAVFGDNRSVMSLLMCGVLTHVTFLSRWRSAQAPRACPRKSPRQCGEDAGWLLSCSSISWTDKRQTAPLRFCILHLY